MGNLTQKDIGFYLDNASAVLTDISAYVNQQDLERTIQMLESEGEGQVERTFLPGLGSGMIRPNGFVNTTTDGIFGPLVSTNTSITKTFAFKQSAGRFYKGEAWPSQVKYSGSRDSLQTWSCDLTVSGAFTRTSLVGT